MCTVSLAVPDEFSFDPVSKTYGDPQRRPEIRSATIEFIAPSEYMVSSYVPLSVTCCLDEQYCVVWKIMRFYCGWFFACL